MDNKGPTPVGVGQKSLQHGCQHFFLAHGAQVGGGDVEDGLTADLAAVMHLHQGPGAGDEDGRGELGIGIQGQLVLDGLGVLPDV